jgi:hypothetical protein
MSRMRIGVATLALAGSLAVFGAGLASADRVVIEPPRIFVPEAEFEYGHGYYRTHEGHYYHYDKDRSGWHYGRTHAEGVRWEREHEHEHEHRGDGDHRR